MSRHWLEVATAALVRSPGEDSGSMSRVQDVHGLAPLTMLPPGFCAWDEWEPMYIDLPSVPLRVRFPCREPMYIDPVGERVRVPCREPLRVPWPSEPERERRRSRSPCGANLECNEEVWQRRSAHRVKGVAAIKRSADYISATASPHVPRPKTPDPMDRKLAKRAWERGNQQWRMDLKAVVQLLLPVV